MLLNRNRWPKLSSAVRSLYRRTIVSTRHCVSAGGRGLPPPKYCSYSIFSVRTSRSNWFRSSSTVGMAVYGTAISSVRCVGTDVNKRVRGLVAKGKPPPVGGDFRSRGMGAKAFQIMPFEVSARGRFWNSGLQQLGELIGRYGPAEIVSLRFITMMSLQESHLLLRFHALRHDPEIQAAAHADNRADNRRIVRSGGDLVDERLVDLEGVDLKF